MSSASEDEDDESMPFNFINPQEDDSTNGGLPWIIEVNVQIMDGRKFTIQVNQFSNVSELKNTIMEMHSIPLCHQHLFYNCKLLEDNYTLVYYEVENGVTLKMNLGETIEKCEFYSLRADLLDSNVENIEFGCEAKTLLSLCKFGKDRPISAPNAEITIQILNGKAFAVAASTLGTVSKLKEVIEAQEKIPVGHQHLFYNCKILEADRTLVNYEIQSGSVITMNLGMSMTGCRFYYLRPELFDMQYSCDYSLTNMHNTGDMFCAGKPYIRPLEARRFAIKVRGKYDKMQWLGQPSTSNRVNPGEWPMAYHGTSEVNILEIVNSGFDLAKCVRFAFGKGIYCSPNPATALMYSADYSCELNNKGVYRVILQCRANPEKLKVVKAADAHQGEYWTVPDGADLRPYGVCVYYYPNGYQASLVNMNAGTQLRQSMRQTTSAQYQNFQASLQSITNTAINSMRQQTMGIQPPPLSTPTAQSSSQQSQFQSLHIQQSIPRMLTPAIPVQQRQTAPQSVVQRQPMAALLSTLQQPVQPPLPRSRYVNNQGTLTITNPPPPMGTGSTQQRYVIRQPVLPNLQVTSQPQRFQTVQQPMRFQQPPNQLGIRQGAISNSQGTFQPQSFVQQPPNLHGIPPALPPNIQSTSQSQRFVRPVNLTLGTQYRMPQQQQPPPPPRGAVQITQAYYQQQSQQHHPRQRQTRPAGGVSIRYVRPYNVQTLRQRTHPLPPVQKAPSQ